MQSNPPQVLIDIGALSCGCSDHALESLAKAISGEDATGPDIWALHENPFIQSLIELFSSRGLLRIQKVQDELNAWLAGKHHNPMVTVPLSAPDSAMLRWSTDELSLVRLYLESLPTIDYVLSDWALVIDYLVHRYMPVGELQAEAEWLAVRSTIMGKVQANLNGTASVSEANAIMAALPLTVKGAQQSFDFIGNTKINNILEYARLRGCDHVVQITEATRHRLKQVIYAHQEKILMGENPPAHSLQTQLFDEFAILNRDWRRLSVTEVGENANMGFIASIKLGGRVKRMEQYRGACPFCRRIDGMVFTVVDVGQKDKDEKTQVWVGKTNVGRSASPRKRVGSELIKRTPDEMWTVAAGTQHPNCRGLWHALPDAKPTDDPDFAAWMAMVLKKPEKA